MEILTSPNFLNFVVPLIAVCASIFLKFATRNDLHQSFRKEDLAFGLDISVTAVLLLITSASHLATKLASDPDNTELKDKLLFVPWILGAILLGLWGVSTVVRKIGWDGEEQLRPIRGIVIPGIFGVVALLYVVNWIPKT